MEKIQIWKMLALSSIAPYTCIHIMRIIKTLPFWSLGLERFLVYLNNLVSSSQVFLLVHIVKNVKFVIFGHFCGFGGNSMLPYKGLGLPEGFILPVSTSIYD